MLKNLGKRGMDKVDKWERINKFINSPFCCNVTNLTVGSSRWARN